MDGAQFILEIGFIFGISALVFKIFRSRITPIKRLSTWLVAFIICSGGVDLANRYIAEAHILPDNIAHLPLQAIAASILILFVPVRNDKKNQEESAQKDSNLDESASTSSETKAAGTGKKSHPPAKRRFRKK